jgi:hypothetical protein
MSTNDLHALLKRWAELEPEMCRWKGDATIHLARFAHVVYPECAAVSNIERAIIQAAVQEAAEARGWLWSVSFDPGANGSPYFTMIQRPVTRHGLMYTSPDAPAAGLLDCYVRALEAEAAAPATEPARPLSPGERQNEKE